MAGYVLCPCCRLRMIHTEPLDPRLCKPCIVHCVGSDRCEVLFMSKQELRRCHE